MSNSQSCAGHHKNPTICLRALARHFLNSDRLDAMTTAHCPLPVPVLNHLLGEKPFSDILPQSLLTQLYTISLSSVTGHDSDEISTCPSASSHEDTEDHNEVFPQFPLHQAEQTKLPLLFLKSLASSPITVPMASFECSLFYIVVPKLPPGFEVRLHQCRAGQDNPLPCWQCRV